MTNSQQCSEYITYFGQGVSVSLDIFIGLLFVLVCAYLLKLLISREHYIPVAPSLVELERRHKYLGLLIERKKKALLKAA